MFLTLPVIAPEVPCHIEFGGAGERHVRLVLAMSQYGLIADDDLAGMDKAGLSNTALRKLIEKVWHRAIGKDFEFSLISASATLLMPSSDFEDWFVDEKNKPTVGLVIRAGQCETIAVGKAFEAIEAEQPGLGSKALDVLDSTMCRFGTPHTPSGAYSLAQMLYWMGEEDEKVAMEEYGPDNEIPTREELFGNLPLWSYDHDPAIPKLTDDEFSAAVNRLAGTRVGKLLEALLALKQLEIEWGRFADRFDDDESYPEMPPILLGWNEPEDLLRMFDDNYQQSMECGNDAPWVACVDFAPTPQGISEAMPRICHTGTVLRALDTALKEARDLNNEL